MIHHIYQMRKMRFSNFRIFSAQRVIKSELDSKYSFFQSSTFNDWNINFLNHKLEYLFCLIDGMCMIVSSYRDIRNKILWHVNDSLHSSIFLTWWMKISVIYSYLWVYWGIWRITCYLLILFHLAELKPNNYR
jgi:hypothetical protein